MPMTSGMIKAYETFGSMTVADLYGTLNAMKNQFILEHKQEKYHKVQVLMDWMDAHPKVFLNALPIEVMNSPELRSQLDILNEVMEDYYDIYDQNLQSIKQNLYKARYVLECAGKAVKAYDKIQARKTSSVVGKG